jgi:uncharacterized protein YdaU (DUF1376 family)
MKSVFCYQHNIEKYNDDTAGMSLIQHGAYRRLLDAYYKTQARLPQNHKELCRIVGCCGRAEMEAVKYIVLRFFTVGDDGFLRQNGAEKELARILSLSEENRRKAYAKHLKYNKTGVAAAHATAVPEGMPEPCQLSTINYQLRETLTTTTILKAAPEGFERFWEQFPKQRKGNKEKALSAYRNAIKRSTEEEIHEGTVRYAASDEVLRGFAKGAAAWLNDDRWRNEYKPPQSPNTPHPAPKPTNYERALFAGVFGEIC